MVINNFERGFLSKTSRTKSGPKRGGFYFTFYVKNGLKIKSRRMKGGGKIGVETKGKAGSLER